ncbi:MAG: tyrosine-type recombinase/integrase [Gloeobacteraceae cyanobacterium ES-bin-144]|nr:tyrosine-type recombinase/integrase [Verrucomicrobiales bacterium]
MKEAIQAYLVGPHKKTPFWSMRYRLPGMTKEKQKSLKVRDERTAQRLMLEFVIEEERIAAGLLPSRKQREDANASLETLLRSHLLDLQAQNCDATHIKNRGYLIRKVVRESEWNSTRDISAESFISWRAKHLDLAPKTLNNYLAEMLAFLNSLVNTDYLTENPLARVPRVKAHKKARPRRALTDEEITAFLAAAPAERRLIYLIALHTGLRRNEIKQLEWQDVFLDAESPFIKLRAATTKNRKGDEVTIHPELHEELKKLHDASPLPCSRVVKMFAGLAPFKIDLTAAGISFEDGQDRRFDFHAMRMTFNTRMANGNIPTRSCMQAMRHSDEKLTTVVYTDASRLNVAAHVASLPALLAPLVSAIVSGKSESAGNKRPLADTVETFTLDAQPAYNQDFSHTLTQSGTLCLELKKSSLTRART